MTLKTPTDRRGILRLFSTNLEWLRTKDDGDHVEDAHRQRRKLDAVLYKFGMAEEEGRF